MPSLFIFHLALVMSIMVSFVLSFFPRDVLDEILDLIETISEGFSTYSFSSTVAPIFDGVCIT